MSEIPEGNWYCVDCDNTDDDDSSGSEELEEEADADEIYDLQNEIEEQIGQLPATRLRNRQQPQIIRTLQSERIRNAILARRALRSNTTIQQDLIPSTSSSCTAPTRSVAKKAPAKKRKSTRRRARRVTRVVEYEIKDGQKFPVKTTRVVRRKKRKSRKIKKARRTVGRKVCGTSRSSIAASFKNANASVYDLQKDRQSAGLSNFNIFEPTNQLDYVPDEDMAEEFESQNSAGSTLIQSVVNYTNPFRRQALIKKRVINNFTTTSSDVNLIDLILNQHSAYDAFNKLSKESAIQKVKKSTTDHNESTSQAPNNNQSRPSENYSNYNSMSTTSSNLEAENISNQQMSSSRDNNEDNFNVSTSAHENITVLSEKKSPQKKKKSATFDMFGDSPDNQENKDEEEGPQIAEVCPNFSIYGNRNSDENLANVEQQDETIEENLDLVQMSDGEHNISEDIEPAVIRSQPASPDLENDINEQLIPEERSYTPPLVVAKDKTPEESVEKRTSNSGKKDRDHHKKHRRRELERYNVRERFKSPKRVRDRFGRNRTRSRSHSNERHKARKSRSFSRDRDRDRHRSRNKKSKTPEKRRRRSYSRSPSSNERDRNSSKHHKSKHKKSYRKSRSATPQKYRDKSPRRRDRSASDKSKKKKRRNRSPEKPSAHTKEVFASGQNILVSVNFNNQDEKRSSRSKSGDNDETVVDITAKKKINVNSKPVAIIDLARSPFKELTPEYKKESNVIELSDSEGEKYANNANKAPKSPDSTKLYDPFDILNSPSNENVSSSQTTATTTTLKALGKNSIDFTNKLGPAIIKNLNIPLISNNEENLVSSSSSINNIFEKVFPPTPIASNSKIEVLQNEVIQIPSIATVNNATIESPYSPGNDYDDAQCHEMEVVEETNTNEKQTTNIFDDLFGSSTPPFLEKAKSTKKCKSVLITFEIPSFPSLTFDVF